MYNKNVINNFFRDTKRENIEMQSYKILNTCIITRVICFNYTDNEFVCVLLESSNIQITDSILDIYS